MIQESDYKFFPPSAYSFTYTGMTIPELDKKELDLLSFNREDLFYILEWMKELQSTLHYGYMYDQAAPRISATGDWYHNENIVLQTPRTLNPAGYNTGWSSSGAYMNWYYTLSCGPYYSSYLYRTATCDSSLGCSICPFDVGDDWDTYWAPLEEWSEGFIGYYGDASYRKQYGFDLAPKPESILSGMDLSNLLSNCYGAGSFWGSSYRYDDYPTPHKDAIRLVYWHLNRLSNFGWECSFDYGSQNYQYIDNSIEGIKWKYHPWEIEYRLSNSYQYKPIIGPVTDSDTTIWEETEYYLSGNYVSSYIQQLSMLSQSEYTPYGSPVHGIRNYCRWENISMWQTVLLPEHWTFNNGKQHIWWYRSTGNPKYIVNPALKGKIKKLGVWQVIEVNESYETYEDSAADFPDGQRCYFYKFFPLTKIDDNCGYETWEDQSGFWNDSHNMIDFLTDKVLQLRKKQAGYETLYSYIAQRNLEQAFFVQLDTEKCKFFIDGWNWEPHAISVSEDTTSE